MKFCDGSNIDGNNSDGNNSDCNNSDGNNSDGNNSDGNNSDCSNSDIFSKKQLDALTNEVMFKGQRFAILAMFTFIKNIARLQDSALSIYHLLLRC